MGHGAGLWTPRSPNARDLHPTDEDLFVGTPDLEHPHFLGQEAVMKFAYEQALFMEYLYIEH
jgi:hypothetical protein